MEKGVLSGSDGTLRVLERVYWVVQTTYCVFWWGFTEWVRRHFAFYGKGCTELIRRYIACFGEGKLSGSDGIVRVLVRVHWVGKTDHCVLWKGCTEWVRRHIACFGEGVLSGSDGTMSVLVRCTEWVRRQNACLALQCFCVQFWLGHGGTALQTALYISDWATVGQRYKLLCKILSGARWDSATNCCVHFWLGHGGTTLQTAV